jgi:hypothetical protein
MLETAELPKTKRPAKEPHYDSWVVEVPPEVARCNGLAQRTAVILTIRRGVIEAELVPSTPEADKAVDDFVAEFGEALEEMRRLGD